MLQLDWKRMLAAFGAVSFLIILITTRATDPFWNAVALGGLMIFFWIFEVISIYVTALLPFILAIPLGLLDSSDLAASYGNSNVYLFFGGFVLALGLEKWKVHEQIARRIINVVGDSKPRILLGFILSTGFLSMWISNTATALMMLPMAIAIIQAMPIAHQKSKFSLLLMLSIAYASSIGGVGTLVGSPPNTQMAAILQKNFHVTVSFLDWMKIGMPIAIVMLLIMFLVFYLALGKERKEIHDVNLPNVLWTNEQLRAMAIFGLVVLLWSFRELITHWTGFKYGDESAAIFGAILLFIVPGKSEKKPLLDWKDTEKLPWGILLLFGGGLALAQIFEKNGIVEKLTTIFQSYEHMSVPAIVLIVVVISVFASEVMSNLALVTIFVPVIASFAKESGYDILQLCMTLTLGASLAFMMPVGTPPNAIVFSSGYVKIHQMVKMGFIFNLIGIALITLFAILFL
jgi:sodium-dependent dicarboxylate transporter 2/3/5